MTAGDGASPCWKAGVFTSRLLMSNEEHPVTHTRVQPSKRKGKVTTAGNSTRGHRYSFEEAARMLQISALTLRTWLKKADIVPLQLAHDHRYKLLTMEHVRLLNKLHGRRDTDLLLGTPYEAVKGRRGPPQIVHPPVDQLAALTTAYAELAAKMTDVLDALQVLQQEQNTNTE